MVVNRDWVELGCQFDPVSIVQVSMSRNIEGSGALVVGYVSSSVARACSSHARATYACVTSNDSSVEY